MAPDQYAGKTWRCPDCRTPFVVEAPGAKKGAAGEGASRRRLLVALAVLLLALAAAAAFALLR